MLSVSSVLAIGITVPRFPIQEFYPNMELRQYFWTFNSHNQEMYIDVSIGGDAGKYATLSATVLKLPPNGVAEFDVVIRTPEMLPAGFNDVEITVQERPPSGSRMAASAAATVNIRIRVPYEGKWPNAKLKVPNTPEDQLVIANMTIENMGKIDINDLYADITFYDVNNYEVGRVESQHVPLASHGVISLLVPWSHNSTPGIYTAKAVVHGDENETAVQDDFIIGEMDVRLVDITKDLVAGQINGIEFTLLSRWSVTLRGVKAVVLAGPEESMMWRAVGPDFTLPPWNPFSVTQYVNVPSVSPGIYPGHVDLAFEGVTKRFDVQFNVKAGPEVQSPSTPTQKVALTGVRLLLLLVIIVIVVLFWHRRRKKNNA